VLRPGLLDDLGLAPAVEWYAEEFEKHTGITPQLVVRGGEAGLDGERATALFRILQEALTIATTKFIGLRREAFGDFPEGEKLRDAAREIKEATLQLRDAAQRTMESLHASTRAIAQLAEGPQSLALRAAISPPPNPPPSRA